MLLATAMPILPIATPLQANALISGATGIVLFSAWAWHLLRGPLPEAPQRTAHLLMAFIYGHGGLTALAALRLVPEHGLMWVVAALVMMPVLGSLLGIPEKWKRRFNINDEALRYAGREDFSRGIREGL